MDGGNAQERLNLLPAAQEHVLAQEDGKEHCLNAVRELSQAFALAVPHPETFPHSGRRGLLPSGEGGIVEAGRGRARPEEALDLAVRQIISRAVASEGVLDIFAAADWTSQTSRSSPTSSCRGAGNASTQPRRRASTEAAQG